MGRNGGRTPGTYGKYWWTARGSNSRPPHCERGALPAELAAHSYLYSRLPDRRDGPHTIQECNTATPDGASQRLSRAQRIKGLQRAAGIENHHRIAGFDDAVAEATRLTAWSAAPPSGACADASRAELAHACDHVAASGLAPPWPAFAHRAQHQKVADCFLGTRKPSATVRASSTFRNAQRPARTPGRSAHNARPAPRPSSAAGQSTPADVFTSPRTPFHIPTMPVPPPVG